MAGTPNRLLLDVYVAIPPLSGDTSQGYSLRPSERDLPTVLIWVSNTNLYLIIIKLLLKQFI